MPILGFELEEIIRLIQMLEASGLDEIVIKEENRYLRVRAPHAPGTVAVHHAAPAAHVPLAPRALPPAAAPEPDEDQIVLSSPMMGMFYRAEKPGGAPLITVGQVVSVGQAIGIIEAMKIFSEVLAEHAGIVIAVPAEDGQLVHAGAPLVILRKE